MANLVELFDNIVQMQNLNGVPLANGKMYVYALGRTRLMDTWSDADGESLNSNPIILDAAGQCHCYVSDDFDYSCVVTDAYDNEIFSIDKYLYSEGSHSHADVAVAPSETIAVSSYHVGETTVYVPYLTGQLGKVYEGIEPIVVNNTEDKISANHVPLGVQDPLYFVQDDEEGCIIGFSGQTIPEGVMSESSLGFENNKITGYNGSAFSAGNEYEAGSYVDITDNTISVTGLQPEGDYAYNSALSSKLDVTATGQFLTGLPDDLVYTGDMTAYQPAGDYQTAGDYLSASDSGKFYPMEGNPSGFLTEHQSLAGYATEQWVENKGYLTGVDIPESANWNEATTVVNNNSAIWNNTTNIVSSKSAQWGAANPQIPVTGINGIKISESGDQVVFEVSGDYAVAADLTGKQDSLTFGYKDIAISSIDNSALYDNSAHARITTLAGRISNLSSNKLDSSAFSDVSATFLTAVPDTYLQNTDLATTDGKVTAISGIPLSAGGNVAVYTDAALPNSTQLDADIAAGKAICIVYDGRNYWFDRKRNDYYFYGADAYSTFLYYLLFRPGDNSWSQGQRVLATKSWVTGQGYLTGVDLTPYQTTAGMTAYQSAGDYLTTADSGNFLTAVPDTYLQNTDLSTTDGKVTAISGIPLSAGGDVPEGVMVESGLEYNAVNEISGYNGSAIAQYGAEKQWLVHDDTLVHAANSAQYALGVNLSAVAQLLGVDETVLWENTTSAYTKDITWPQTLSENITGFTKVKFLYAGDEYYKPKYSEFDATEGEYELTDFLQHLNYSGYMFIRFGRFRLSGTNFTNTNNMTINCVNDQNWQGLSNIGWNKVYKVIGIGRKA